MGLTAMEAMACGAAVIVPQRGGANSFVKDGQNGIIVDTTSPAECCAALERLVTDSEFRARLQRRAMIDICRYSPELAAFNILNSLFR
jgi:glycosyltransferase involved in cell wall biosynthesis